MFLETRIKGDKLMSKWIEDFNLSSLTETWGLLLKSLEEPELIKKYNEDNIEDIARLKKVIVYLDGILKNLDPELAPLAQITKLNSATQSCVNELNAFIGSGNVGHLTNSNASADQLLMIFHQLPASNFGVSKGNVKNAVSEYSKTIGIYISKYKKETDKNINELLEKVGKINNDIEGNVRMLTGLANDIKTVEQTIQQQTSQFNTQYQNSEQRRADLFNKAYEKQAFNTELEFSKYEKIIDEEFKNLSTKSTTIIEVLVKLQDDASKVYGVTINTLQGGAYSSYASDERKIANRLRLLASSLMFIGVGFLVIPEILSLYKNVDYSFEWLKVLGRIPLSLVVFVPAFYFARESTKHRNTEVFNRRRQHILSTLEPYLELMETEEAQTLRTHVAKTVFSEASTSSVSNEMETGNILSQLANLAKQLKGS